MIRLVVVIGAVGLVAALCVWQLAGAGLLLSGTTAGAPSAVPYQVNVTDTLQTAGAPPYQVGTP